MPVNFKFTPLTGPLSGPAFISQTEKGFNELGSTIDDICTTTEETLFAAQQAQRASQQAITMATDALSTATIAHDASTQAYEASKIATETALKATEKADSSYDIAATSLSIAESATITATEALTTSSDAKQTADDAINFSNNALTFAEGLSTKLDDLNKFASTFQVDNDSLDIDAFHRPDRIYFSGISVIANAPKGQTAGRLEVTVAQEEEQDIKVFQTFYAPGGSPVFRREGEIAIIDDEEIVTWGEWLETGANQGRVTAHSPAGTREETIPAAEPYEVPEYVVGSGALTVYLNGLICVAGDDPAIHQYKEIGEEGEDGTAITFHNDMLPEYDILVTA